MPARLKQLTHSRFAPLTLPVAAVAVIALAMAASAFAQVSPTPRVTWGSALSASSTTSQHLATYTNDQLHFSLTAPADMTYEVENRGYEQVIEFSNPDASRVFGVVAAPYTELDVGTGEEAPPGTATDQSEQLGIVTISHEDNVRVSFHRNGITYTVSSIQPDAQAWLLPILQSWQFTN
jgi:hypothetical protein